MNASEMKNVLAQMGIKPEDLGPDKIKQLMDLADNITNPEQITDDTVAKLAKIIGVKIPKGSGSLLPLKDKQILPTVKIGRNVTCPCNSGKKYKKCCGLPK